MSNKIKDNVNWLKGMGDQAPSSKTNNFEVKQSYKLLDYK